GHDVGGERDCTSSAYHGDSNPGKVAHDPPPLPALPNEVSGAASADGAHTPHGQADGSDSASPKFADDGGTNSGKVPHDPPGLTALANDVSGDDPAHPAHTNQGQSEESREGEGPKFAEDGDANTGKVPQEPPALTARAKDENGDDSAHGAHTAHGQADRSGDSAGPKFADDGGTNSGKVPHDPPGLTALANDSSGDDPAQPGKTNQG